MIEKADFSLGPKCPEAIDDEGIGMMVELVHPDVGPFFTKEQTCLLTFPYELLNKIMSSPGFQPVPIRRTGARLAFQKNVQVAKCARE